MALRTAYLRLGSLSSCISYRSPVLLARMAADIDHLSGGRLVLGLGIGDDVEEFARRGLPSPSVRRRQQVLEETIDIVHRVGGAVPFTYHGRHFRVEAAQVPLPSLQPHVPLLMGSGGESRTLRQVARYADVTNFGPHPWIGGALTVADVRRKFAALRRHCETLGRPYDAILRSHFLFVLLATTGAALQTTYDAIPEASLSFMATLLFAGTRDELVAYYQPLVAAGMQYFVVVPIVEGREETLRLLAERVMPAFA